ncbi:hypothetical protein F5050DRAFT_1712146 [Lentinula boryana]|uniref:Uncharacterized protein n=1 Tax=Lentinula boryana TaxID=40481 RepID=A0ABQ8QCY5_9AGAR|nr:hypothetical protein F5050DRAFT_1712146 [Lentinula boryana]
MRLIPFLPLHRTSFLSFLSAITLVVTVFASPVTITIRQPELEPQNKFGVYVARAYPARSSIADSEDLYIGKGSGVDKKQVVHLYLENPDPDARVIGYKFSNNAIIPAHQGPKPENFDSYALLIGFITIDNPREQLQDLQNLSVLKSHAALLGIGDIKDDLSFAAVAMHVLYLSGIGAWKELYATMKATRSRK